MTRTDKVIYYLTRFKKLLYLNARKTKGPCSAKIFIDDANEVDALIEELKRYGCRRTIDEK